MTSLMQKCTVVTSKVCLTTKLTIAWVTPVVRTEVTGPCFVHQQQEDGSAIVLSMNAPLMQVETSVVEAPSLPSHADADGATIAGAEVTPSNIHQVWVATNLPETDKWTFRSAQGTFLACDSYGDVTATNEARGPQEEWVLHKVDPLAELAEPDAEPVRGPRAGYALHSKYGGWLAIDAQRKRLVRADDKELTSACIWDVSVQWRFRHAQRKTQRAGTVASAASAATLVDEARLARTRQGWTAGTAHHVPQDSRRELLRAQREGRLAEAMLDRRSKLKSDKYTKVCLTYSRSESSLFPLLVLFNSFGRAPRKNDIALLTLLLRVPEREQARR